VYERIEKQFEKLWVSFGCVSMKSLMLLFAIRIRGYEAIIRHCWCDFTPSHHDFQLQESRHVLKAALATGNLNVCGVRSSDGFWASISFLPHIERNTERRK
jgi:hypothetical protein